MSQSRRNFLKSVTAASVASTLGNAAIFSQAYATQVSTRYGTVTVDNLPGSGNTLGIVGDEVTSKFYFAPADGSAVKYMANGYLTWALALSGQRLRIVSNQARPAATVKDQFLAQVNACISAGVTDIVCMGGQNDLRQGVTLDALKAAWTTVIARASAGAQRVWWLTQTPLNPGAASATTAVRDTIGALNTWILSKAAEFPNVVAIDVTTDISRIHPTDGHLAWKYFSGAAGVTSFNYSADGVTPINVGAFYIGQAVANKWNAAISNNFELASDRLDDIVGDPRSVNIVHNSLFNEGIGVSSFDALTGGSGYSNDGFDLVFSGGSGGGAIAKAVVTNGVVTGISVINAGQYSVAPDVSFEKGTGSGAAGTIKLGPVGFANLSRTNETELVPHPDGNAYGNMVKLKVPFPNYQFSGGLRYASTMNRPITNHLGPKDVFSVRCEVRRDALSDKLAAVGPAVQMFNSAGSAYYHSCAVSTDDQALPSTVQFRAVFQTPPAVIGASSYAELLLSVSNDQSYAAGATATVMVGRFSCLVQPSVTYTRAEKGIVNFHPGHYVMLYAGGYGYGHFTTQDSFETGMSPDSQTATTAAWRGVELPQYWKDLEPTKGDYKLDVIQHWLDGLRDYKNKDGTAVAKYLLLILLSDSYVRPAADSFPQYILTDPEYEGGVYQHNGGKGYKTRYDNVYIQDRLIALAQKIAERFDNDLVFEGFRIDETSPGDTLPQVLKDYNLAKGKNVTLTDYVEGQARIAVEMNKAFKRSLFTIGFNYVADLKDTRLLRMLVQAGVGIGAVDIVQNQPTLSGQYMSYDLIKSASRFVTSLAHFDSGNYLSNTNVVQDLSTVTDFTVTHTGASHISWYRQWPSSWPCNYSHLVAYMNAKKTQAQWQSAAGCTDTLNTVPPESIS